MNHRNRNIYVMHFKVILRILGWVGVSDEVFFITSDHITVIENYIFQEKYNYMYTFIYGLWIYKSLCYQTPRSFLWRLMN